MLKTFALRGRDVPITIYGPPGLSDLFDALRRIFGKLSYTVELKELRPGDELIREDYRLVPFAVAHGVSAARRTVPSPAAWSTSSSCRGPAWAPRTCVPFSEIAWAQQSAVEAE